MSAMVFKTIGFAGKQPSWQPLLHIPHLHTVILSYISDAHLAENTLMGFNKREVVEDAF